MIAQQIKTLRKQAQLSQQQLAEKIHVSRQAVTKWETGAGVPDIDNLQALSALFGVSLDTLLHSQPDQSQTPAKETFAFESMTEYDMDGSKNYDITFAGARQVVLCSGEGEKLYVRLASDQIPDIQSTFKVKIDDLKERIDVDVRRFGAMSETQAKAELFLFICLPQKYLRRVELKGHTAKLIVEHFTAEGLEYCGKTQQVILDQVCAHVEIDSNMDLAVSCRQMSGRLDLNQISATSTLSLPAGIPFAANIHGIANHIFYEKDGERTDDFSQPTEDRAKNDLVIEVNGIRSELVINALSATCPPEADADARETR